LKKKKRRYSMPFDFRFLVWGSGSSCCFGSKKKF